MLAIYLSSPVVMWFALTQFGRYSCLFILATFLIKLSFSEIKHLNKTFEPVRKQHKIFMKIIYLPKWCVVCETAEFIKCNVKKKEKYWATVFLAKNIIDQNHSVKEISTFYTEFDNKIFKYYQHTYFHFSFMKCLEPVFNYYNNKFSL